MMKFKIWILFVTLFKKTKLKKLKNIHQFMKNMDIKIIIMNFNKNFLYNAQIMI